MLPTVQLIPDAIIPGNAEDGILVSNTRNVLLAALLFAQTKFRF